MISIWKAEFHIPTRKLFHFRLHSHSIRFCFVGLSRVNTYPGFILFALCWAFNTMSNYLARYFVALSWTLFGKDRQNKVIWVKFKGKQSNYLKVIFLTLNQSLNIFLRAWLQNIEWPFHPPTHSPNLTSKVFVSKSLNCC